MQFVLRLGERSAILPVDWVWQKRAERTRTQSDGFDLRMAHKFLLAQANHAQENVAVDFLECSRRPFLQIGVFLARPSN